MKQFNILMSLLLMVAFVACTSMEPEDPEVLSPSLSLSNVGDLSLVKGLAADGESSVDIMVPVRKSNTDPSITITAVDEEWGDIEPSGILKLDNKSFDFYRYTLTSEERLPSTLTSEDIANLKYNIEVDDRVSGSYVFPINISVIRSAVIFVHGLASGVDTYDPMLGYIGNMGLFMSESLYAADYSATSTDSYDVNLNVVPEAIEQTRQQLLDLGYVNEKFTLVGHSMGGILTRLYIQNESDDYPYQDDILKIITIDTPHSGSQLADFALTLDDKNPDSPLAIFSKMGAIVDLAVESDATKSLNDSAKLAEANALQIPTHVVTAHIGTNLDVAQLIKEKQYIYAAISFILDAIESKLIYGDDESDIVVPMRSQLGGVEGTLLAKYVTTYANEWHCSVHTTEQAATDVIELLNAESGDKKLFTTDGFAPEVLTYTSNVGSDIEFVEVNERPILSDVVNQLIIGVNATGNIVSVAYDTDKNSSFELGDDSSDGVIAELYLARMKSGELRYMQSVR